MLPSVPAARYRSKYKPRHAVTEAPYLFRDRNLEPLLRRNLGWRTVRFRVLGMDLTATGWRGRANGKAMRLTWSSLEFREGREIKRLGWLDMQQIVQADCGYRIRSSPRS